MHERVATIAPQHQQFPLCLRNDVNNGGTREGSNNGALALLIIPCSCDDYGSGGAAEDGTLALPIVLCSCNDNGGVGADNGALALPIVPRSREREGGMMRGDVTASGAS